MAVFFESFTKRYKLSRTLNFSLLPIGKTRENMNVFLEHDQARADAYRDVKKLLDNAHKQLIERTFSNISQKIAALSQDQKKKYTKNGILSENDINWSFLNETLESDKDKNEIEKVQLQYCQLLSHLFKQDSLYEDLVKNATPDKFFKQSLASKNECDDSTRELLALFNKYTCYFIGFQENRKNIYSEEKETTAAPYRAIFDNFPKFKRCVAIYNHIRDNYPEILQQAASELKETLAGQNLTTVFSIDYYSNLLAQGKTGQHASMGIDWFNNILGGYTLQNGEKKKGLNEFINLYRQQHEEARQDRSFAPMPSLFKQILSDRSSISFIPETFQNDAEIIATLRNYINDHIEHCQSAFASSNNLIDGIRNCLNGIKDDSGIFVSAKSITDISHRIFGNWNAIKEAMDTWAETNIKTKANREKWLKKTAYSIAELLQLDMNSNPESDMCQYSILDFWKDQKTFDNVKNTTGELKSVLEKYSAKDSLDYRLKNDKQAVAAIKNYLDSLMGILHLLRPLYIQDEPVINEAFYSEFVPLYEELNLLIPLYNRIRNHLTKKIGEEKKIKLIFNNATLATGWDLNKEKHYSAVIFLKENDYYLGIINPNGKKVNVNDYCTQTLPSGVGYYKKMVYKYLPGPNKMLPKVFFSQKGQKDFGPPQSILDGYEAQKHIKSSSNFSLDFCHKLIDFFKASIAQHPDWKTFDFKFSSTSSYQGIDDFYREISEQGYRLTFTYITESKINELVASGQLLLFKIYNKDFAEGATGLANKFTLYWKSLFSEENLSNVVTKLNGKAELFWRKPVIDSPYVHREGEKMVNRTYIDGVDAQGKSIIKHMSETTHKLLVDFVNGKISQLPAGSEAKELYTARKAVIKKVTHDIIKNRRYTKEQISFHVPITINYKAPDKPTKFNDEVREFIKNKQQVNIIGIDRGERNLIYYSLINTKGEILQQGSLNSISTRENDSVDYHALLDQREKERDDARKNWESINQIKDLKSGYMSQVIHKIAKLMIENNAIVVLEDLNSGFKRGRFAIEKQVYQNFESALITKLNYLTFKNINNDIQPGGVLNGYQLTEPFTSFRKKDKQTGFLFYVPAAYTSKIDPTTGFVNLFSMTKLTNAEARKDFFSKFGSIVYCKAQNAFAFTFDYKNFKTQITPPAKSQWTVFSATKRYTFRKNERTTVLENPTAAILDALKSRNIPVDDKFDLKSYMQSIEANKINAEFFRTVYKAFELSLQMRNSNAVTGEDFIESPVKNASGEFFHSSKTNNKLPYDADANGAFHIAMKGLYLIQNVINKNGKELKIEHPAWLEFMTSRNTK